MHRLALLLALSFALGCGEGDGTHVDDLTADAASVTDANVVDDDAGSALPDAPSVSDPLAGCSEFETAEQYFDWLIEMRISYSPHDRYKGIPWQGSYHNNATFPLAFTWSDELAATAEAEAQRLAGGGPPAGVRVPGQDPGIRALWIAGVNTASYRITAAEYPGDWVPEDYTGNTSAALKNSNGSARLGFFYHDYGGGGPVLTRAGLSGAADGSCRVWWVLQVAP